MFKSVITATALALSMGSAQAADSISRIPVPNFPISSLVTVPSTATTYYLSGFVPSKEGDSYGDTKAQSINVLKQIEKQLKEVGLTMGDVVKMQVFLVADPAKGNKMDFAGFMEAYKQFFATAEQPNMPSRSTFQVAALANPDFLVEIEVTAAK